MNTVIRKCALGILAFPGLVMAQTELSNPPEVNFNAFVDIFYAYDFNEPVTDYRQPFHFNFNRHNEFNLNLGIIGASVSHEKYRANLGLQAGTYAIDNYALEDPVMRHVYEANAGISLNKQNNLWLDAGIFGSHLGFESAISIDNWTLTRSLSAENSPYFLTGAKITYDPSDRWTIGATVSNGWQRIRRVPGNSLPAFGTQLAYHVGDVFTLNWSTLFGTEDPDDMRRWRMFHNLYGIFSVGDRARAIVGFDIGQQQTTMGSSDYDIWYIPTGIVQVDLADKLATTFRVEYFSDEGEVIVDLAEDSFNVLGLSLNLDYTPFDNVAARVEGRWFSAQEEVFALSDTGFSDQNFTIITSLAVRM